jgi:hypothetical protein
MRSVVVMVVVSMLGVGLVVPARAAADDGESESDGGLHVDWVEVAGWSLVGTGAAMWVANFAIIHPWISSIDSDPVIERQRDRTPRGDDACEEAESDRATDPMAAEAADLCAKADTLYTVGAVLLGGGLVSMITGLAMVLLDEDPPEQGAASTRVSFGAGIHPHGADVGLRLRF